MTQTWRGVIIAAVTVIAMYETALLGSYLRRRRTWERWNWRVLVGIDSYYRWLDRIDQDQDD